MKLFLSFFVIAMAVQTFAHDDHNWLNDKAAFEFTKKALIEPEPLVPFVNKKYTKFDIDPNYLKEKLMELAGGKQVVINGKQVVIKERGSNSNIALAREYLAKEFSQLGFKISKHAFPRGANFVAEKTGRDPSKVLIISSHIDSVRNAGANDDGAGTVSALAVAKALSKYRFEYTLRYVGFDKEEIGTVGSNYYVKDISKKSEIIGDIQVEMMGTNSRNDGAFHLIDCDRPDSTFLSRHMIGAIEDLKLPIKRVRACTTRSDHRAFWNASIPAIVISENFFGGDSDRCYHRSCDIVDGRLNFNYMANIAEAIAATVAEIIQIY